MNINIYKNADISHNRLHETGVFQTIILLIFYIVERIILAK